MDLMREPWLAAVGLRWALDNLRVDGERVVLDATGVKMSKSRGNVVDPFEVVTKYGVDAVFVSNHGGRAENSRAWVMVFERTDTGMPYIVGMQDSEDVRREYTEKGFRLGQGADVGKFVVQEGVDILPMLLNQHR